MAKSVPLPTIISGSESFFQRGDDTGCLCLHGFMASPAEISWLGSHLAEPGYTVYLPRIAGHGADPHDMARMRWRDWYLSALDGYQVLRQQCARVYVVGHSMGGLLALLLAASVAVDGVAALAAPLYPSQKAIRYTPWLKYFRRYFTIPDSNTFTDQVLDEQVRRGEPAIGRVNYTRWSVQAVAELYALMQVTRQHLPEITAPLLLIYSQQDDTVPLANMAEIAGLVRSAHVEQHTLNECNHIITQDVEREEAFCAVADFIAEQIKESQSETE